MVPFRGSDGRFLAGNPGRPVGSRNRLAKRVARRILRDFETHADDVLTCMRCLETPTYMALVVRLLPRLAENGGADLDDLAPGEAAAIVAEAKAAIARIEAGLGSLDELDAALLGERHNSGAVINGE